MLRRMSAAIVLGVSATLAQAGGIAAPPVHHANQWWTSPAGCEYSRSGRPGGGRDLDRDQGTARRGLPAICRGWQPLCPWPRIRTEQPHLPRAQC